MCHVLPSTCLCLLCKCARLTAAGLSLMLAVSLGVAQAGTAESSPGPRRLRVADDHRHLVDAQGRPFFYIGDTAWELFHRLNREEAALYLENRARKGFTVIQAVVLAELDGLTEPNPYGHKPLRDDDPTRPSVVEGPNNDYWDHADFIVGKAASLGLVVGMLPTWGANWNRKWGKRAEIFTPENAAVYGEWLGRRYRDQPVIWILGGDRNPENDRHLAIIRAMAAGLARGDGGAHLMTFHPQGGSCSDQWFHRDEWLDFNMFQSGHAARDIANDEFTLKARGRDPVKPVLDGEPRYEDHPINWKADNGWFEAFDVRQAAYWSMLAGACGHTYGDHNIWQFWQPGRGPISQARTPWKTAIDHPASTQVGHMRRLFESRPWTRLAPDPSIVAGDAGKGGERVRAARAEDGSFLMVYAPFGQTVQVQLNKLAGRNVTAWWFDPRKGTAEKIGTWPKSPARAFDPPGEPGRGNDWVLVADDEAAGFDVPGLQPN